MTFLTPLFLLGAAAITLPVVFHLIRRTTRERTAFSSLMFLLPTPPRLTRRSRLEHILLLVLRCLALCVLAAGFARPFIQKAVSEDHSAAVARRIVILIDASASMRRPGLWAGARERVESVLSKATPADRVALYTFDRQVTPLVTFDQWNSAPAGERAALAKSKLAEISPGWAGTQVGNALVRAAETLADASGKSADGPSQIVLISDLQEGGHLEPLQGYEWPRNLELTVEVLKPRPANNAALQKVIDSDDSDPKAAGGLRVRVSNAAESRRDQFQVGWARSDGRTFAGEPVGVYVPPGQSRIVTLRSPLDGAAVDRVKLAGDDEDFDNTLFVVPAETNRSTVLYLGSDSADDPKHPLYFLQRAFRDTGHQAVTILMPLSRSSGQSAGAITPAAGLSADLRAATLFILTDPLPELNLREVRERVLAGKTALLVLTGKGMGPVLAGLLGLDQVSVDEPRLDSYAMLADIDFRHPLFVPFADPRFSDFTKIHFWHYRRIDPAAIPGARVVAKFDSGDPAVVEIPTGKGRVLVLASGWHPEDSQLALSSKFVPLLYSLLDDSGSLSPAPTEYHIGDIVPLLPNPQPSALNPQPLAIRLPDGSESNLAAGETNFSRTLLPGIYTVSSAQPPKRFAVNLDPAESRLAPLSLELLERLGAPISRQAPVAVREIARKIHLQNSELEARQKLWRWFIIAALVVLLAETWLAGRAARRTASPAAPAAT